MSAGPFAGDDRRLDAAVRAAARADQGALANHPSPHQLADYSLGAHAPEEEDLIQEHLALCPECAEVVLGLMESPAIAGGEKALARPELAREWERLQGRVPQAAAGAESFRSRLPPSRAFRPPLPAAALAWGLAASLVVSAGLVFWVLRLRGEIAEARGPSAEVVLAALEPEGAARERGREEPLPRFQLQSSGRLVLLLNLGDLRSFPRYRVELRNGRGEVLWQAGDVHRSEVGTFAVDLPARRFGPGSYEVRLYGAGPRDERLAVYRFELVKHPAPLGDDY